MVIQQVVIRLTASYNYNPASYILLTYFVRILSYKVRMKDGNSTDKYMKHHVLSFYMFLQLFLWKKELAKSRNCFISFSFSHPNAGDLLYLKQDMTLSQTPCLWYSYLSYNSQIAVKYLSNLAYIWLSSKLISVSTSLIQASVNQHNFTSLLIAYILPYYEPLFARKALAKDILASI